MFMRTRCALDLSTVEAPPTVQGRCSLAQGRLTTYLSGKHPTRIPLVVHADRPDRCRPSAAWGPRPAASGTRLETRKPLPFGIEGGCRVLGNSEVQEAAALGTGGR